MNKDVNRNNLFSVYRSMLERFSSFHFYNWNGKFLKEESDRYMKQFKDWIGEVDLNKLTEEQAKLLGFKKWDEHNSLMLIPLYLFDCIKKGNVVTGIGGEKKVWGIDHIDNDERFGVLSWGFYPKKRVTP